MEIYLFIFSSCVNRLEQPHSCAALRFKVSPVFVHPIVCPTFHVFMTILKTRLHKAVDLEPEMIHPIVLDTHHAITKLFKKAYDHNLFCPGLECAFAELRCTYWILRGREAIHRYQFSCPKCFKWQTTLEVSKMADLPAAISDFISHHFTQLE